MEHNISIVRKEVKKVVILGVIKDLITITAGIVSSWKTLLEIKKLKGSKGKPRNRHRK